MIQIKRTITKVNNLKLFYYDTYSENECILCLHGKWGRAETWMDFIYRYMNDFRIIAPDQRGHGLSDKPVTRYAPSDFAEDSYMLLKQLKTKPAIVVGHSMGGRNAAFLAALHPEVVKALVILDIGTSGSEFLSTLPPSEIVPIDELTVEWPTPYKSNSEAVAHLRNVFRYESNVKYFLESLYETIEGYDYMFSRYSMSAIANYLPDWTNILHLIKCPVLLVRAANSTDLTVQEAEIMRSLIKDCTYAEISKSDHMVYIDNPDEFYPVMDAFLEKIS